MKLNVKSCWYFMGVLDWGVLVRIRYLLKGILNPSSEDPTASWDYIPSKDSKMDTRKVLQQRHFLRDASNAFLQV